MKTRTRIPTVAALIMTWVCGTLGSAQEPPVADLTNGRKWLKINVPASLRFVGPKKPVFPVSKYSYVADEPKVVIFVTDQPASGPKVLASVVCSRLVDRMMKADDVSSGKQDVFKDDPRGAAIVFGRDPTSLKRYVASLHYRRIAGRDRSVQVNMWTQAKGDRLIVDDVRTMIESIKIVE